MTMTPDEAKANVSDMEHQICAIPMHDAQAFEAELKRLNEAGWRYLPDFPPVALYHFVRERPKPVAEPGLQGRLVIDDSKIGILRNGKMI